MSELPNYLPTIPPMYGLKQPSTEVHQGNDVEVEFELNFNGVPVIDNSGWKLEVFVKKSLKAENVLWKVTLGENMFQKSKTDNVYYFRIPAAISARFLPGNYYFSVLGTQKIGTGQDFDRKVTLFQGMFNLTLDAASPFPKLQTSAVTAFNYDLDSQKWIITTESTEATEPTPVSLIV